MDHPKIVHDGITFDDVLLIPARSDFVPSDEWLLEAGDMLYLPPGWGHDGVADGETITASIGFRSAGRDSLGVDVLQQMLDVVRSDDREPRYADPDQPATRLIANTGVNWSVGMPMLA